MIKRHIKNKIIKLLSHFPALAILGPRQVGKTTLAKDIMGLNKIGKEFVYVDLEYPADFALLQEEVLFFESNIEKCIIIDEVQRMPSLFPVLRSMIDRHRVNARFILLGSASPDVLAKSSETLAGRIVYTELTPFNILELLPDYDYRHHWLAGGFPEAYFLDDVFLRDEWFRSFVITYLERELKYLGLNADSQRLSRFMNILSHCHGQLLQKTTLSKALEVSSPTISTYLNYMENAFLIRTLYPFSFNTKKRLVKSPKVYMRDSGLVHSLLGIKNYNQLLGHPIVGNSWEGYVIEQIISCFNQDYEYYFYRTQDGTECDLLICENYQPLAVVEIKFTSTPQKTRGLTVAIQDLGTKHNFIIIPETQHSYSLAENIMVCDLIWFIKNFKEVVI